MQYETLMRALSALNIAILICSSLGAGPDRVSASPKGFSVYFRFLIIPEKSVEPWPDMLKAS